MDLRGIDSHRFGNQSSRVSEMTTAEMVSAQDECDALFINYAAVAWHEMRRAWRGDECLASQRNPKKEVMSWSTSYPDLLSSKEPFDKPIPLSMVKFVVEIWKQEHL